jgi:enoyl-[acyl-carrier protein] reductase III
MINLKGHIALVTGASRGIGKATALRLAECGADVVVNYVSSSSAARETAEEIIAKGRNAYIVKADVRERTDVQSMLEFVASEIGQLNILVGNAASGGFHALLASTENNFAAAMNTNVLSLISLVQASAPLLKKSTSRAKIIAISSHGSTMAIPWYGLIGASKAALESVARHLTLEVGDYANVNVIKAGLVETDSTRSIPNADKMFAGRTEKTMVGNRYLQPEDVANAVCFLSSSLSDMIQGTVLTVDGGSEIHI